MFGFAFLLMFVCVMGTSALELGEDVSKDGKLTYNKEASETFSYQVVKVEVSKLDAIEANAEALAKKIETDTAAFEKAYEEFEADDTNSDLEDAFNAALEALKKDMDDWNALVATAGKYGTSWNEVSSNNTSGTIEVGVPSETEAYILWVKSDDYTALTTDGIMAGGIFTKDSSIDVPTDVTDPTITPDTKKDEVQNTNNVKNPKTGVNLPIALGIATIALAGLGVYVIRKTSAFKQI